VRVLALFVLLCQSALHAGPITVFSLPGEVLANVRRKDLEHVPKPGLYRKEGRYTVLAGYASAKSGDNLPLNLPDPEICNTWYAIFEEPNGDNVGGFYLGEERSCVFMGNRYHNDLLEQDPPWGFDRHTLHKYGSGPSVYVNGLTYMSYEATDEPRALRDQLQIGDYSMSQFLEKLIRNIPELESNPELIIRPPRVHQGYSMDLHLLTGIINLIYLAEGLHDKPELQKEEAQRIHMILKDMIFNRLDQVSCELSEEGSYFIINIKSAEDLRQPEALEQYIKGISKALGDFFVHMILTSELQQGKSIPTLSWAKCMGIDPDCLVS